jgi:peptidoglycan hydrolase CwlO-like protein
MQLNSTSSFDSNADRQVYIYVSDTEKRLQKSIDDIKEMIRDSTSRTQDSFKSLKDDMTKMEGKIEKMEGKIEKNTVDIAKIKEEFLITKILQVVVFLTLATIQPDIRSIVSTIIGSIKV